jgi:thiol-disulfide isomerase/thioredoxin
MVALLKSIMNMKFQAIITLCCLNLAIQNINSQAHTEVYISGTASPSIGVIEYSIPIKGAYYEGFASKAGISPQGRFLIKLPCAQTSTIFLNIDGHEKHLMVIEPGDRVELNIVGEGDKYSFDLEGPNEAGQVLYNQLPKTLQLALSLYQDDTSSVSIQQKMTSAKRNEFSQFEKLLHSKKITKTFYDYVKADLDCYYAALQTQLLLRRLLEADYTNLATIAPSFRRVLQKTVSEYPFTQNRFLSSRWWYDYTDAYLGLELLLDQDFQPTVMGNVISYGLDHTLRFNRAKQYFQGQYLEFYLAAHLHEAGLADQNNEHLMTAFSQFKRSFKQSEYLQFIIPVYESLALKEQLAREGFSEQIKMVGGFERFNNLQEVLKPFRGKKLYVDVWATWCYPCRVEFQYIEQTRKILQKEGVEMLFISLDNEANHEGWKAMIKEYNLEGTHIRANEALKSDLANTFNRQGRIFIPWYLMVNERGEIVRSFAYKPSDFSGLERQLSAIQLKK